SSVPRVISVSPSSIPFPFSSSTAAFSLESLSPQAARANANNRAIIPVNNIRFFILCPVSLCSVIDLFYRNRGGDDKRQILSKKRKNKVLSGNSQSESGLTRKCSLMLIFCV